MDIFSTKIWSPIANGNGNAVVNPVLGALKLRVFNTPVEEADLTSTPLEFNVGITLDASDNPLPPAFTSTDKTELPWFVADNITLESPTKIGLGVEL